MAMALAALAVQVVAVKEEVLKVRLPPELLIRAVVVEAQESDMVVPMVQQAAQASSSSKYLTT